MEMPAEPALTIPGQTTMDDLDTWVTSSQDPTAGTARLMGVATDGSPRAKETPGSSELSAAVLSEV